MQTIGSTQPTNADQIITMQSMGAVNTQTQFVKEPMLQQPQQQDIKHIELPKINANQQLFSLNTITNQITQLSAGISTASLGPMERLLIVPAGVNKQQLAKCLLQGQIHFDSTGKPKEFSFNVLSTTSYFSKEIGYFITTFLNICKLGAPPQSNDLKIPSLAQMPMHQRTIQLQSSPMNASPMVSVTPPPVVKVPTAPTSNKVHTAYYFRTILCFE